MKNIPTTCFLECFRQLHLRWQKCRAAEGKSFEGGCVDNVSINHIREDTEVSERFDPGSIGWKHKMFSTCSPNYIRLAIKKLFYIYKS